MTQNERENLALIIAGATALNMAFINQMNAPEEAYRNRVAKSKELNDELHAAIHRFVLDLPAEGQNHAK